MRFLRELGPEAIASASSRRSAKAMITPEHIRQADENLRRPPRRPLWLAFLVELLPALAIAMFGVVIAEGYQQHSQQLKLVGFIGGISLILFFWLRLFDRR